MPQGLLHAQMDVQSMEQTNNTKSLFIAMGRRKRATARIILKAKSSSSQKVPLENDMLSSSPLVNGNGNGENQIIPIDNGAVCSYTVNGKSLSTYFRDDPFSLGAVKTPFELLPEGGYPFLDVTIKVSGGGLKSQAEAIRLGLSKALVQMEPHFRILFREAGFLTTDARRKERKKYGLKKARKAPQFSKR